MRTITKHYTGEKQKDLAIKAHTFFRDEPVDWIGALRQKESQKVINILYSANRFEVAVKKRLMRETNDNRQIYRIMGCFINASIASRRGDINLLFFIIDFIYTELSRLELYEFLRALADIAKKVIDRIKKDYPGLSLPYLMAKDLEQIHYEVILYKKFLWKIIYKY